MGKRSFEIAVLPLKERDNIHRPYDWFIFPLHVLWLVHLSTTLHVIGSSFLYTSCDWFNFPLHVMWLVNLYTTLHVIGSTFQYTSRDWFIFPLLLMWLVHLSTTLTRYYVAFYDEMYGEWENICQITNNGYKFKIWIVDCNEQTKNDSQKIQPNNPFPYRFVINCEHMSQVPANNAVRHDLVCSFVSISCVQFDDVHSLGPRPFN